MNKKRIIIIGSSGHSKVVIDIIELIPEFEVVGLIDTFKKAGEIVNGHQILGDENDIPILSKKLHIDGGVIAIGNNWHRKMMSEKVSMVSPYFNYYSIKHPNAIISPKCSIENGTVIMAGAIINSNVSIGKHCIVNTGSIIEHDCVLFDFSSLAPGVVCGGNSEIGNLSAIGIGATIIQNITIGTETIIGANSLVNKNFSNNIVAYGVPAREVSNNNRKETYLKN